MTHNRLTAIQLYGIIATLIIATIFVFIGIRATVFMMSFVMIFFLAIGGTKGLTNTIGELHRGLRQWRILQRARKYDHLRTYSYGNDIYVIDSNSGEVKKY